MQDSENILIITLTDNNGKIEANRVIKPSTLSMITLVETNYLAFDIVSTDYHVQLHGY